MVRVARTAIESLYTGICIVTEYQGIKDEVTKKTKYSEVTVLTNQLCKLSYKQINSAVQTETGSTISQSTKLFISPDVTIKPGSKITVTQNGVTEAYKNSGKPAAYDTHQEIVLELFERWS